MKTSGEGWAGGSAGNVDWNNVLPGQMQIIDNGAGGTEVLGPVIPLLDSPNTQKYNATISSAGTIISSEVQTFSGSSQIGSAIGSPQANGTELLQITGQGVEAGADNATVAAVGHSFEFTGDGNTISCVPDVSANEQPVGSTDRFATSRTFARRPPSRPYRRARAHVSDTSNRGGTGALLVR